MHDDCISNEYEKFWIKDNIMYGEFTEGLILDMDKAKICLADRLILANGKDFPFLLDARGLHSMTKEARDFLGSKNGSQGIIASAIVIGSPVTKIIGNFFTKINKPLIPVRLFNEKAEAHKWLSQFLKKDA